MAHTFLQADAYYLFAQLDNTPKSIEVGPYWNDHTSCVPIDTETINSVRISQGHPERVVTAMVFTDIPTMESWMTANGFTPADYPIQ